jgi:hypothetical protein
MLTSITLGQAMPVDRLERKVDGHVHYNEGRTIEIKQGDQRPWLTIVTSDDWENDPKQVAFWRWFQTDPRLSSIARQVGDRFKIWKGSNPHYRERFAEVYGTLFPIVSLQAADGTLLVGFDAASMPETPGLLADYFDQVLERSNQTVAAKFGQCPDDRCPKPNVTPNRNPPNKITLPVTPPTGANDIAVVVIIAVGFVFAVFLLIAMNKKKSSDFF